MLTGKGKRVWIDEVWGEVLVRGICGHPTSTWYQADREGFWKPWNLFKDMITSKIVGWQCHSHSKPFSCLKHSHSQVHMKLYNTFQNADMKKGRLFWQPQYLIALTWACHSLWCNCLWLFTMQCFDDFCKNAETLQESAVLLVSVISTFAPYNKVSLNCNFGNCL